MKEFERKFLVNSLPDLSGLTPTKYVRCFLYIGSDGQIRAQQRGDKFEIEAVFGNTRKRVDISPQAFEAISSGCTKRIERLTYPLTDNTKIKIYQPPYNGLYIADIEFASLQESSTFNKPDWLGPEITDTKLGKDRQIILLTRDQVFDIIKTLKQNEFAR